MNTLYVKQNVFKITDHYRIFDENQTPVYQADQDFKLVGNTVHVSDLHGQEVFVINKVVFTLLPKYEVHFRGGREMILQS
ncbi:MAG: LURP-one-related family protein [Clostridia bacterium]